MQLSDRESSLKKISSAVNEQSNISSETEGWFTEAPVAMIILNKEGTITLSNQLAFQLLKAPIHEIIGTHLSQFIPAFKPVDKLENIRTFISAADKPTDKESRRLQCRDNTGRVFPVSVKASWVTGYNIDQCLIIISDDSEAEKTRQELKLLQQGLEFKVKIRTVELADKIRELDAAKSHLKKTIRELNQTQEELIQSEKMAALGGLVAGIAHEINTPVGIGVTAITHLEDKLGEIKNKYDSQAMGRSDLEEFFNLLAEFSNIISANLNRASSLIRSFKQIAVDQSSDDIREFKLVEYLEEAILSLKPTLRKNAISVTINPAPEMIMLSYPGSLAQIITNLTMNAVIHAFPDQQEKHVEITIVEDKGNVRLAFSDNGIGMESNISEKIFDPFFTTKRGQGGSGLGLHLVFNIVSKILQGKISCTSTVGKGTTFDISMPMKVKETSQ